MNIWEILDISPTTDRKTIKKAYAAQSKIFHPEEKPEEFERLYQAYQEALAYAKNASLEHSESAAESLSQQKNPRQPEPSQQPDELQLPRDFPQQEDLPQPEDSPELLSYFANNQKRQQKLLDTFQKHWEETQSPYKNPQVLAWWRDYLSSEDFQDIRWDPRIVQFLTQNIDRKFYYGGDEMKLLFWDAYGFQEYEEAEREYQGDLQKLWKCLYQALEHQKKALLAAQQQLLYEKKQRFYQKLLVAGILFICLLIPMDILYKREGGRQYLIQYMKKQYSGTEFSSPRKTEKLASGKFRYTLHAFSHPELLITADVTYLENDRSYQVSEDYSPLLLKYYADQYGLACGKTEYGSYQRKQCGILYYPDMEKAGAFCETVSRMFREQEELNHLTPVGICGENLLFPHVLLQGGVYGFSFPEPQFYEPWTMDADELETQLLEARMIYMFQYEPWNLTLQQYEKWGPAYEKLCEQWQEYKGTWYTIRRDGTDEILCQLYLPIYRYVNSYTRFGDYSLPNYIQEMTVGSAYYYLLGRGAKVTVNEDGSGFSVEFQGNTGHWGDEPAVTFHELDSWY